MVHLAVEVADQLAQKGISVEVVDPRSTSPLDEESILESVEKTGRLIVVDESARRCGMAADIAGMVAEKAFSALTGPIIQITPPHTPVPFSPVLEDAWMPSAQRIEQAVLRLTANT